MKKIPVYTIKLPEYAVDTMPDHADIGAKIDNVIKTYFIGEDLVIRCLGSAEHPGKTADEIIEIIQQTGTDRYDPERVGDRYENVNHRKIDFFALPFKIAADSKIMEQFIESFYAWPLQLRGYPVRVDVIILYDPTRLNRVIHTYSDGRTKDDGYVFKFPGQKVESIKAILQIL